MVEEDPRDENYEPLRQNLALAEAEGRARKGP